MAMETPSKLLGGVVLGLTWLAFVGRAFSRRAPTRASKALLPGHPSSGLPIAPRTGRIELILGPMFSGKTTEMVSRVRRAALANQAGLIIKYSGDTRYNQRATVATHAEICQSSVPETSAQAAIRVECTTKLADVAVIESVIGVDEGQFYPDLIEMCTRWAREGKCVIVAALDGDFAARPFGQTCSLVPHCESVEKRRGVCMICRHRESSFTQRLGSSTALIEIGASESYRAVCRQCLEACP